MIILLWQIIKQTSVKTRALGSPDWSPLMPHSDNIHNEPFIYLDTVDLSLPERRLNKNQRNNESALISAGQCCSENNTSFLHCYCYEIPSLFLPSTYRFPSPRNAQENLLKRRPPSRQIILLLSSCMSCIQSTVYSHPSIHFTGSIWCDFHVGAALSNILSFSRVS